MRVMLTIKLGCIKSTLNNTAINRAEGHPPSIILKQVSTATTKLWKSKRYMLSIMKNIETKVKKQSKKATRKPLRSSQHWLSVAESSPANTAYINYLLR